MIVKNSVGREFLIKVIQHGESYGLTGSLVNNGDTLIEFYDASADKEKFGELGQFVARYSMKVLARIAVDDRGLLLDGGVPEWRVTADNLKTAVCYAVFLSI